MISAKLCGGLGGRLFQIATAYALALDNDDVCAFDLLAGTISQEVEMDVYMSNIFKKLNRLPKEWQYSVYYQERDYNYSPIPYSENLMLGGYFGSELYFKHRTKELCELLKEEETINNLDLDFKNSVSLHVRRGDYLINASHVLDADYYRKAIKYMDCVARIDRIYVVSDDIPWCKDTFKDDRITFSENNPPYIDFYVQTQCEHNIIANSTYSRMATNLNENPNKITIAPSVWFGGDLANKITDVFKNKWVFI